MSQTPPWYDIDLRDRWQKDASGWHADLPEFGRLLPGHADAVSLLEDGVPVPPAPRAGAEGVWYAGGKLTFRPCDGGDPTGNGRRYVATLPSQPSPRFTGHHHLILHKVESPFGRTSGGWLAPLPEFGYPRGGRWSDSLPGSPLVVLQDGVPTDYGRVVDRQGPGHGHALHLSEEGGAPADRTYAIAVTTVEDWPVPVVKWPADGPFRRLEDGQELPIYLAMGLTDKCNLRCTICGSQTHLDSVKQARRFSEIDTIRRIAATTFPFAREVELNSYGEPTLHRHFEEIVDLINRYGCLLKLQTNGTLLRPRVIDSLKNSRGFIWISLDATGKIFEAVRKNGRWADVDAGVRDLMRATDPRHLRVGLYPTITSTTLPAMLDVVQWAHEVGIQSVHFHLYDPIAGGTERRPGPEEVKERAEEIGRFLAATPNAPDVQIGSDWLKYTGKDRVEVEWGKIPASGHPSHPVPHDQGSAHPDHICRAPWQQMDFDLDGKIKPCCRSKQRLGWADTPDTFCDAWFGETYAALRQSMHRSHKGNMVLPECDKCIHSHRSPFQAAGRNSPQRVLTDGEVALRPPFDRESGHCFLLDLPDEFETDGDSMAYPQQSPWILFEDERQMGPAHAMHASIRNLGMGPFSHWGGQLYFSTSDNSDPNHNGRTYILRRRSTVPPSPWDRLRNAATTRWSNLPRNLSSRMSSMWAAFSGIWRS